MKQLILFNFIGLILTLSACSTKKPSAVFIKNQTGTECVCFDRISPEDATLGDKIVFGGKWFTLVAYQYGEFYEYQSVESYNTFARDFKTDSLPKQGVFYKFAKKCGE